MRSITSNILLAFITWGHARSVNAADTVVDKMVDELVDRVLNGPLNEADQDDTTLGALALSPQTSLRAGRALPTPHARAPWPTHNLGMSHKSQGQRFDQCVIGNRHAPAFSSRATPSHRSNSMRTYALGKDEPIVMIGVAADSGCGKSTFMRRLTNVFGGDTVGPLGGGFGNGGWETNTLVSDQTTVICLDDYHLNDREGRKVSKRTALDTAEQKFDLMYEQLAALKKGDAVKKPIYNHVNGTLDTPEEIKPTPIIIIEGLHPFVDERVRKLLDFSIYLDITDDVKFAWKVQRDMQERGHSLESIKASIEARKPDFDAYVAPQRQNSDLIIQVLPTELAKDDTGKILKVKFIQAKNPNFEPAYIFDEGSTVDWTPCGTKLACDYPGIKLKSGPDTFMDKEVQVLEMDGEFSKVEDLCYIESHVSNLDTKFYGELTQSMVKNKGAPGNNNGSGFLQNLAALKLRALYEKISGKVTAPSS